MAFGKTSTKPAATIGVDLDVAGLCGLLESLQANVLVATPDLRLVYANAAALAAFATIEDAVHQQFGIRLDSLIGGSIHRFHRDPTRVEQILRTAPMPHRASFTFGPITLDTRINRVLDSSGTTQCYTVCWDDVSRQTTLERALADSAAELANASGLLNTSCVALLGSASTASDQASSVAVATEELSSTLGEVARSTNLAVSTANAAADSASEAAGAISDLTHAGAEVGEVVRLIEGIAQQTNLLALNATIEAARAGDAGKGFAIVAAEVKELSNSTRIGTEQIARLTERLAVLSAKVAEDLSGISGAIAEICDQQHMIASAIDQQHAATGEISESVSRLAAAAAESSAQTHEVYRAAEQLTSNADHLRSLVD